MKTSRIFRESNLAELHANHFYKLRQTKNDTLIEFVFRYEYSGRYAVLCVGINKFGVSYTGSALDSGNYFFQIDTNDTFGQVQDDPEKLYFDDLLALGARKKEQ